MTIELPKDVRQQAIASIERYFQENMDEKIGNIAAGGLLGFFVETFGLAFDLATLVRPRGALGAFFVGLCMFGLTAVIRVRGLADVERVSTIFKDKI